MDKRRKLDRRDLETGRGLRPSGQVVNKPQELGSL